MAKNGVNAKNAKEALKGAGALAGNTMAIAGHGLQKVSQSRAARIAKTTGKILARAALMRNPVAATFYGEFNKIRNDYVRMEEFKMQQKTDNDGNVIREGRPILHPDWERQNQNS